MAFNLGDIFVTFKANTDGLKKGLSDVQDVANKTKNIGEKMSGYLKDSADASKQFATGIGVAGAAVVGFGVLSVKAFSESQDLIAQTNAVLKSTGGIAGVTADQVNKLASAFERQTKFSDEEIRSAENLLLTFTKINKDIFPQATSLVLDMSQALGQDLKSSAIQLGKALQDPVLGVTALRRVGVAFSQDQQDVIAKLVETGQSAKAQAMIMKELTTEFGGSAKAAGDTFAGKLIRLKNQLNNVQEAIGEILVNAIQPLIEGMLDWIEKAGGVEGIMAKLRDGFDKIRPFIPAIAGAIIGGLVPAVVAATLAFGSWFLTMLPWFALGAAFVVLWQKSKVLFFALAGAVTGLAVAFGVIMLPTIIASTAAFISLAIAVIAATWPFILIGAVAAAAAYLIITHWTEIKTLFGKIFESLKRWVGEARDALVGKWNEIKDVTLSVWNSVKDTVVGAFEAIQGWIEKHKKGLTDIATVISLLLGPLMIKLAAQALATGIQMAASAIVAGATWAAQALVAGGAWLAQAVVAGGAWLVQFAIMTAQAIATGAINAGQAIISGIAWLTQAAIAGGAWLVQFAIMAAGAIATGAVFIASAIAAGIAWIIALGPVALAIGALAVLAFVVMRNWDTLKGWFAGLWNWFAGTVSWLGGVIRNVFASAADFIIAPYRAAFNAIARFWNATVGKLSFKAPDWVPGLGGKGFSLPQLPTFATGVQNFRGGFAVVGEQGPEVAYLPPGSSVYPNSASQGMLGGVTIEQVIIQSPSDADYFFKKFGRNIKLSSRGMSTEPGSVGV